MSWICLRLFFNLPARPTKIEQKWKFLTSVFFVRFGWNLVWGLIMGQKQHRMSLIYLQPFFDLLARPTKINQKWKFLTSVFFCQIWMNDMGAKNGPRIIWHKFKILLFTHQPKPRTFRRGPLFFSDFFCLKIKYFMPNSVQCPFQPGVNTSRSWSRHARCNTRSGICKWI